MRSAPPGCERGRSGRGLGLRRGPARGSAGPRTGCSSRGPARGPSGPGPGAGSAPSPPRLRTALTGRGASPSRAMISRHGGRGEPTVAHRALPTRADARAEFPWPAAEANRSPHSCDTTPASSSPARYRMPRSRSRRGVRRSASTRRRVGRRRRLRGELHGHDGRRRTLAALPTLLARACGRPLRCAVADRLDDAGGSRRRG